MLLTGVLGPDRVDLHRHGGDDLVLDLAILPNHGHRLLTAGAKPFFFGDFDDDFFGGKRLGRPWPPPAPFLFRRDLQLLIGSFVYKWGFRFLGRIEEEELARMLGQSFALATKQLFQKEAKFFLEEIQLLGELFFHGSKSQVFSTEFFVLLPQGF